MKSLTIIKIGIVKIPVKQIVINLIILPKAQNKEERIGDVQKKHLMFRKISMPEMNVKKM